MASFATDLLLMLCALSLPYWHLILAAFLVLKQAVVQKWVACRAKVPFFILATSSSDGKDPNLPLLKRYLLSLSQGEFGLSCKMIENF